MKDDEITMATIKSFTSLEQSKKLAEILPLESADMTYDAITEGVREKMIIKDWQANIGLDIAIKENRFSYRNGYMVPCWSLASLLGVLHDYTLQTNMDGTVFVVCDSKKPMTSDAYSNAVDACVAMIEKLHKLNLL